MEYILFKIQIHKLHIKNIPEYIEMDPIIGTIVFAFIIWKITYLIHYTSFNQNPSQYIITGNGWRTKSRRTVRSLDSVIIDIKIKEGLLQTIYDFLESKAWYREMQIPYRLGIVLFGPPGNGKSSLIEALSFETSLDIYYLDLVKCTTIDEITDILEQVPKRQMIVIEDLDMIIKNLTLRDGNWEHAHSFIIRQLLHIMEDHSGSIIVITTNNYKDIPNEFKRAGRFDRVYNIQNPGLYELKQYFERFFPNDANATVFATKAKQLDLPMCEIQNYLTLYRRDSDAALNNLEEYFKNRQI
jgi:chaperone BCS1